MTGSAKRAGDHDAGVALVADEGCGEAGVEGDLAEVARRGGRHEAQHAALVAQGEADVRGGDGGASFPEADDKNPVPFARGAAG